MAETKGRGDQKGTKMTRNLRIIGLALLATVIAVSALAANGAFAEEEEGEEAGDVPGTLVADKGYPATLDGTDSGATSGIFTLFSMSIQCPDSSYSGEITGEEPSFTLIPAYSTKCNEGAHKATVIPNGCGYQFTFRKTTVNKKNEYVDNYFLTSSVVCPPNKDIEIKIYEASDNEDTVRCEITIKEQKGLTQFAKLQNELSGTTTTGSFLLEKQIENINATKTGVGCGGASETKTGKYDLGITVKGTTDTGAENKLTATEKKEE